MSANGEVAATLYPGNRGNKIVVREFAELCDFSGGRVPHVYTGAKTYSENVGRTPVYKIEIEVVGKLGSVKYLPGHFGNGPRLFPRCLEDRLRGATHGRKGVEVGARVEVDDTGVFGSP